MSAPPDGAVELLERALAYTRGSLHRVTPRLLHRPTPCERWDLDQLLAHMDDALDAFTDGAGGAIALTPSAAAPLPVRVATLQSKACDLLGAWTAAEVPGVVRLGELSLPTSVVAAAAALEITVHGWDVAQATGHGTPIPVGLAVGLLPVAQALVADDDRDERFARARATGPGATPATRLLDFLGRTPAWGSRAAS